MRTAAIYDIHANLSALEAVLQEIRQAKVDCVVVGGDVLPGPLPRETIQCLLDLDIPVQFIHGNGDREVLAQMVGRGDRLVPQRARTVARASALDRAATRHPTSAAVRRLAGNVPFRDSRPRRRVFLPRHTAQRHRDLYPSHAR